MQWLHFSTRPLVMVNSPNLSFLMGCQEKNNVVEKNDMRNPCSLKAILGTHKGVKEGVLLN